MNIDKWREILGNIKDNFEVEDEGSYREEESGGIEVEFIIFQGPMGKMKLELETKPVVEGKKTFYSNRIGSDTKVEYVYSETEKTSRFKAFTFREDDGLWIEIDPGMFRRGG